MKLPRSTSPIGLDIGPRSIAAVQGQRAVRGSNWRVEAATIVARPAGVEAIPTAEELNRLQDILYRQGFVGRDVVVAVPDRMVLSATMELPPAGSGAPLVQLARGELARMHRKDVTTLEIATWDIPPPSRTGNYSFMMAVGCVRQELERLLNSIEDASLTPLAVDVRAWAMARACQPALEGTPNVSAILDLGEAEAVLSVVHSGIVVYERVMSDAGIGLLRMRLRQELDLDPEVVDHILEVGGLDCESAEHGREAGAGDEAGMLARAAELTRDFFPSMIQEFRTALAYAVHRYPAGGGEVDRILVHGIGASVPGLVQWISEELGLEIGIVTPAGVASCREWLQEQCSNPGLTTAMGLALHQLGRAA